MTFHDGELKMFQKQNGQFKFGINKNGNGNK
jgi:hypothetical protein